MADLQHFRALLAEAGLTDAATTDDPHYFRLGCGHNSKDKHRKANGGVAPHVRYTELELSRSVSLDEIATGVFGPIWRSLPLKGGAIKNGAKFNSGAFTVAMTDPLVIMAEEIGLHPIFRGNGKIDAFCPNMAAHTHDGREESGFASSVTVRVPASTQVAQY